MAEILTRTYTYTGVSSWTVGESAVALSSFTVSGDTRPITQILSISASWYRLHSTSSTVTHAAELVFGDGSVLRSNSVSKRGDNERFQIETSFMDMPDAAAWVASSITLRTTLSTKLNHVYWRATAAQPMVLTITYVSSEFKPYITNAKLYRANSLGAAADDGTYLSFTAKLALEKLGTGGSGTFRIYSGDSASTTTTQVYSRSVSGSTSGVTVSAAPISGVTIGSGVKKWYRMEFAYTATTDSGASSTETASATFLIGNVFTNVHLAGVSTGGVRFGGYSTASANNPKFECNYPAYFYGGIALVDGGVEERTLAFDADAPFVVRADNPLQPTLRRFGHVIELHGEIQPTQSISGSTTYYPICTLPAEYAPHHEVIVLQQGSNQSVWMLRIFRRDHAEHPCKVMFARFRSGNAWAEAATSAWLPFHATWIV